MKLKCTCYHPAQDKFHGKGWRVHNAMARTSSGQKYRCTVCKNEREAGYATFTPTPVEQAKSGGVK
jgi:hypothetical protein